MSIGRKKIEFKDLSYLPLTISFIETLKKELEKIKDRPEYKTYKFTKDLINQKFIEGSVSYDDENNIYKTFIFPDKIHTLWVDPYNKIIGANLLDEIKSSPKMSRMLEKACNSFDYYFSDEKIESIDQER